jgi:glycosyltransferase involved in cell wall biosynthesis
MSKKNRKENTVSEVIPFPATPRKLKIMVISTTVYPCPPPAYSGLEMVAYLQAVGLARRGHTVTLVAPHTSPPPPEGVILWRSTLGEPEGQAYNYGYHPEVLKQDVIIDNSWEKWSYMAKIQGKTNIPILGVCHAPCNTMYQTPPPLVHPCLVCISKDHSVGAMESWGMPARTAYDGVDVDFYRALPNIQRNDRYLFLARMSKIKGPQIATDVARKLRIPLDLVGDDKFTNEPQLSQRLIAQAVNNITYHGGVSRERCVEFFSKNKALLHMNLLFREPFGLAPVEAQLCGMPVIAYDNGAMRETIKHGETGFLVKSQEEVEELIKTDAVASIKPEACREWASQFSVKAMVDRYEELIYEALDTGGW